jgi:RimJ/RimL family protein N-acetyltransferase
VNQVLETLPPERFGEILPLAEEAGGTFPIIRAVLEGMQPGRVFADPESKTAFVVNRFGFARLLEADGRGEHDAQVEALLTASGPVLPSYLLWYDPPPRWQARLDASGDAVRRRERLRFAFRRERAPYLAEAPSCPEGFSIRAMDPALLTRADKFGLDLGGRFWPSAESFLGGALGVCVVRDEDGEIASLCYAAAVGGGSGEIDVVTDPQFRGLGLGTLAGQAFVRRCAAEGVVPAWDCFTYNEGSARLAEKLGFVPATRYAFYSFNIPVALADASR